MDYAALSPDLRARLDEADPRAIADYVATRLKLTEGDWTLELVFDRGSFRRAHRHHGPLRGGELVMFDEGQPPFAGQR